MADQNPALQQQNLQTSEKSQHFKENTVFNEHPVVYFASIGLSMRLEIDMSKTDLSQNFERLISQNSQMCTFKVQFIVFKGKPRLMFI